MSDDGSMRITMRDLYEMLHRVHEDVSKLVGRAAVADEQTAEHDKRIRDHETRIRKLEAWRYALPTSLATGCAALLVAVLR